MPVFRLGILGDFELFELEGLDQTWVGTDGELSPVDPAPSSKYGAVHLIFYGVALSGTRKLPEHMVSSSDILKCCPTKKLTERFLVALRCFARKHSDAHEPSGGHPGRRLRPVRGAGARDLLAGARQHHQRHGEDPVVPL
eukprot:7083163-Heterocapsa_arctica.AAC.1